MLSFENLLFRNHSCVPFRYCFFKVALNDSFSFTLSQVIHRFESLQLSIFLSILKMLANP